MKYIFLFYLFNLLCLGINSLKFKSSYFPRDVTIPKYYKPFNIIAEKCPNSLYFLDSESNLEDNKIMKYKIWNDDFLYVKENNNAFSPYCPHMGANLEDGVCSKSGVICPFHNRLINYKSTLNNTNVYRINGNIYIDINSNNYEYKILDQLFKYLNQNDFELGGEAESIIECSIGELAENAIDTEHFSTVHGKLMYGLVDLKYQNFSTGFVDEFTSQQVKLRNFPVYLNDLIDIITQRPNVSYSGFDLSAGNSFTKLILNSLGKSKVFSVQFMPGLNVQFDENSVILFHSTPIGPTTTKMNTHVYKRKDTPKQLGDLETFLYSKFLEPDMLILSKKALLNQENDVSTFVLKWRNQYKNNFM